MKMKSVRNICYLDGTVGYDVSERMIRLLLEEGVIVFDGVDGDEGTNTVTYWYAEGGGKL